MDFNSFTRRDFVKGSLSTLALSSLPARFAFAQTSLINRPEWHEFKNTPDYTSFVDAIRTMRANTNSSDWTSWSYWVNAHLRYCPHGVPYFFSWHRGYVHYFQQALRTVSGNSQLMVPYWDYYKNALIPAEFTDPSPDNPLYVSRANIYVRNALSLAPFGVRYKNFPRGMIDAFETQAEPRPHGQIHNLIGGVMATKSAPTDPIFWLHHGMMDRLWAAWVAAGSGRQMPLPSDPYWTGSHTYSSTLTMQRSQTIDTTTYLGYQYQDMALPKSLPPLAAKGRIIRVQMQQTQEKSTLRRPPNGNFETTKPRSTGTNRRSAGGAKNIALDESSVSAPIPVENADSKQLESISEKMRALPFAPGKSGAGPYTSVQVILDDIRLTKLGELGGYYYNVYLNLPETSDASSAEKYWLSSFGPFEITAHEHHPGSAFIKLPATQVLANVSPNEYRQLTISFVRVNSVNVARGRTLVIGEARIELSNDAVE